MTRPCSCLPGTPGSATVLDPHCPVHGKDAAPAWAKVVAYIIVAMVLLILLGVLIHTIRWAFR